MPSQCLMKPRLARRRLPGNTLQSLYPTNSLAAQSSGFQSAISIIAEHSEDLSAVACAHTTNVTCVIELQPVNSTAWGTG